MGEVNAATPDADCAGLLREFAASGSEAAFTEIVRRQVDLVYSTALRRLGGDAALAKDVAQTVFTDLACRSRRQEALISGPVDQGQAPGDTVAQSSTPALPVSLGGWLHRHTCFVAATVVRGEIRRRAREETAMQLRSQADATDWSRVAPVLDDALEELPARDRDALVLRFLERQPFARVGATLGVSEDAARMRVDRALDKLREILGKRGVTSTSAALGLALGQHAIASAPAGFAASFTSAALSAAGTTTWSAIMRSKLTLNKVGIAVATLATLGTLFVLQYRTNTRLRAELDRQSSELVRLRSLPAPAPAEDHADELARLRAEHLELLRLRGELTALRREREEKRMKPAAQKSSADAAREVVKTLPVQIEIATKLYEFKDAALGELGIKPRLNQPVSLTAQQTTELIAAIGRRDDVEAKSAPKVITHSERPARVSVFADGEVAGPTLDVTPHVEQGSRQLVLDLRLGYSAAEKTDGAANGSPKALPGQLVAVEDGQSVLLCQPAPPDALTGAGPRYLLALVTPTCLDPAGHRLFPQAPADAAATKQ